MCGGICGGVSAGVEAIFLLFYYGAYYLLQFVLFISGVAVGFILSKIDKFKR